MGDLDRIKELAKLSKAKSGGKKGGNLDALQKLFGEVEEILTKNDKDRISSLGEKLESGISAQQELLKRFANILSQEPPNVTVNVPEIKVPEIKIPEQKAPVVNVDAADTRKELNAVRGAVDKLESTISARPQKTKWKVVRDKKGFIDQIEAVE
ncbi:MAG: hypothetical protein GY861_02890 [bacterium]|nr:hypothetical protein [bacterium]